MSWPRAARAAAAPPTAPRARRSPRRGRRARGRRRCDPRPPQPQFLQAAPLAARVPRPRDRRARALATVASALAGSGRPRPAAGPLRVAQRPLKRPRSSWEGSRPEQVAGRPGHERGAAARPLELQHLAQLRDVHLQRLARGLRAGPRPRARRSAGRSRRPRWRAAAGQQQRRCFAPRSSIGRSPRGPPAAPGSRTPDPRPDLTAPWRPVGAPGVFREPAPRSHAPVPRAACSDLLAPASSAEVTEILPANEASWDDLQTVFGTRGSAAGCRQCQRFKLRPRESYGSFPAEERAFRLRAQTDCGHPESDTTERPRRLPGRRSRRLVRGPAAHRLPPACCATTACPGRAGTEDKADDSVWAVTCVFSRAPGSAGAASAMRS